MVVCNESIKSKEESILREELQHNSEKPCSDRASPNRVCMEKPA